MKDQTEVFLIDFCEVFLIAFGNQENSGWGGMGCSCFYNHVTLTGLPAKIIIVVYVKIQYNFPGKIPCFFE